MMTRGWGAEGWECADALINPQVPIGTRVPVGTANRRNGDGGCGRASGMKLNKGGPVTPGVTRKGMGQRNSGLGRRRGKNLTGAGKLT